VDGGEPMSLESRASDSCVQPAEAVDFTFLHRYLSLFPQTSLLPILCSGNSEVPTAEPQAGAAASW